jgi:polar amino acid transport system ATP-binding protein
MSGAGASVTGASGRRFGAEAVRIEGLHKSFGTLEVLKGIDLVVHEHDVVEGEEITARGTKVDRIRRRIGIVFQAYNLFPHMNVLSNITLAPRKVLKLSRAEAEREARDLLERFGLAEKAEQYPDRLSGGQQQRVAIVRALAMKPDLLLLDEITSALDPELVAEVLDVIRGLAEQGMTMIIATHEMGFARDIADRVCFLDQGQILEEGPPVEIFGNPRQPRTRQFLDRVISAGRMGGGASGG